MFYNRIIRSNPVQRFKFMDAQPLTLTVQISSGGRDGGGPMQEAITYVFNAPVFGDQNRSAKQVAMLQRRARRDLLLA